MSKLEQIKHSTKFTKEDKEYLIKQLAELKTLIKELEEGATCYPQYLREHKIRANLENVEIPKLEQQLKEKDKEIARLKDVVDSVDKLKQYTDKTTQFVLLDVDTYTREYANKLQLNTKKVCEKIRKEYHKFDSCDDFDWQGFEQFLNQIEKGEDEKI